MIDKHYLCDEVFFTLNSYKIFEARIDVLKVWRDKIKNTTISLDFNQVSLA